MKRLFIFSAIAALLMSCGGNSNSSYTLSGKFENAIGDSIVLLDAISGEVIDSIASTDGSFTFRGNAGVPFYATILYYSSDKSDDEFEGLGFFYPEAAETELFVEPGELQMYMAEDSSYYVKGSKANDNYQALLAYLDSIETIPGGWSLYNEAFGKALGENIDNLLGLYCISRIGLYEGEADAARTLLDMFPENVQQSSYWKSLDETVNNLLRFKEGNEYIEFEQKDADGNIISSKDVMADPANKYVLIDFWASWCSPCMGELPFLKTAYEEFAPKGFQIIGVSLDYVREDWLNAVRENEMDWIHVCRLDNGDNELADTYDVHAIPTNYLIDCETGIIVAKNLRGEELASKLASLLN